MLWRTLTLLDVGETFTDLKNESKNGYPSIPVLNSLTAGSFKDLNEFKKLIARNEPMLARNVVEKLLTYGTGAHPEFVDRFVIEKVVERAKPNQYGLRTLLKETVCSSVFLTK